MRAKHLIVGGSIVAALGVLAIWSFEGHRYFATIFGGSGMSCDALASTVTANWQLPPPAPLQVVDIELENSNSELLDCSGSAIMADGRKIPLSYRAFKVDGTWRYIAEIPG